MAEGICPKCGSNFEYTDSGIYDDWYLYRWECDCGATGKEFL